MSNEIGSLSATRAPGAAQCVREPAAFKAVLVNPYELGRQPFALAEPAAWLKGAGFEVACIDLALQKLDSGALAGAGLVAIHLGMHTATRIALKAIPRIKVLAPSAHLCAYGLYAPMNAPLLEELGVGTVLGGEVEPALLRIAESLRRDKRPEAEPLVNLGRIDFVDPDRSVLPPLERYAHLRMPDGSTRVAGFAEASRGCKHLCRHCPVVPVYQGRFRIVPLPVVMADIRCQVASGARHISFGDPDFLNGPTHALKLVRALHAEFPRVTFDATIKVEHVIDHAALLPELKRCGCLYIISAVEAVDDRILEYLDKNHAAADFSRAAGLLRQAGIAFAPTFVAFTPWTSLEGYVALLRSLIELQLVESVPPVQYCIRLLVPQGSYLLRLPGFRDLIEDFDAKLLGYPWRHRDRRVDELQQQSQAFVAQAGDEHVSRRDIFARIWSMAHEALGMSSPSLDALNLGSAVPHLSEPWYCCAEPTSEQLQAF
jgi:hypothetical protein